MLEGRGQSGDRCPFLTPPTTPRPSPVLPRSGIGDARMEPVSLAWGCGAGRSTRRDLKSLLDGAQVALLGPSHRSPCPGCRALSAQPRAVPAAPSPPVCHRCRPSVPGRTRAARRDFLLRHAVLSALSWAPGRSLYSPAAHALPPLVPGPRSQAERPRGLFQKKDPRAGWGVPARFSPPPSVRASATLQGSASSPTGKPERRVTLRRARAEEREPLREAPGPLCRRGPAGGGSHPAAPGSPEPRRWLIGAAGSSPGEAGGVFADGGWFPPSLAGLIGQTAPWQEGDRDHAGSAPRQ